MFLVFLPRGAMDWSVIVAFPGHTHFIFVGEVKY